MRFLAIIACAAALLAGCVNAPYKTPPSTAAAQEAVNSARGNVDTAAAENQSAATHNRKARTNAELIDNKASVVEKWFSK